MADNSSRFVIIDGVQILRTRAVARGLISAKNHDVDADVDGPPNSRARTSASARKGGKGGVKPEPEAETSALEPDDASPQPADETPVDLSAPDPDDA